MAFVLKDSEIIFTGYFRETSDEQFTFFATNCKTFFKENLSSETIMTRVEEMNESIRYKQSKVITTLKEETPASCAIKFTEDSMRIEVKFIVNKLPLNVFFECSECSPADIGQFFAIGFMKLAVENSLIITKMKKAVEAKDLEIEEYKRNGGTLIRGNLMSDSLEQK